MKLAAKSRAGALSVMVPTAAAICVAVGVLLRGWCPPRPTRGAWGLLCPTPMGRSATMSAPARWRLPLLRDEPP